MPVDSPDLPPGSGDAHEDEWDHLIARAQAGSLPELGQLLETCRNYLLLVASRELPPELRAKGGASDLVQETFLAAQQSFPRFKGSTEREFLAWMKGILKHTSSHFRRGYQGTSGRDVNREVAFGAGRDQGAILEDDATPPSAHASRRELTVVLEHALKQITTRDRDLLTWRGKDKLTFDEMGERLRISNVAARKAWYKAVEHLQEAMATLIPETFKSSSSEPLTDDRKS